MEPDTIRIHAPTPAIFLCGGKTARPQQGSISIRDSFRRALGASKSSPLKEFRFVLAEEATDVFPNPASAYTDLLIFESDIAELSKAVVLICESPGSLAELGAFTMIRRIAENLCVIIEDHYYYQSSFIRKGPISHLEEVYNQSHVYVLQRNIVGIGSKGQTSKIKMSELLRCFEEALLSITSLKSNFQKHQTNIRGHQIKLLSGLIYEYGALTLTEIQECLSILEKPADLKDLKNFLYTAEFMKWIKREKIGNTHYYISTTNVSALDYAFRKGSKIRDRVRWRVRIREHWKAVEPNRFRGIAKFASEHADGI